MHIVSACNDNVYLNQITETFVNEEEKTVLFGAATEKKVINFILIKLE